MNIQSILEFLKGKKTYFAVAIALLYLAGGWLQFWEVDPKVLAAIGMSSLAFLRAGINKGPTSAFCFLLSAFSSCFLLSAFCFSLCGCQTALPTKTAKDSISSLAFLRTGINKVPAFLFCFLLSAFCFSLCGCQTAIATKTAKDGSQDMIQVKSFLGKISQGSYSNGTGMTLSVESASPDQQSIQILSSAVSDLAKMAILASKPPTNAVPAATNAVKPINVQQ